MSAPSPTDGPCAFKPDTWLPFKLLERRPYNHNSRVFRFALEDGQRLNLPVASCVIVQAPIGEDGAAVIRPYTPVSNNEPGYFELLIKVYPNGAMSRHIDSLQPGDELQFKGPFKKVEYGPKYKRRIGMLAGGSGITPMLQVLNEIERVDEDDTEVTLVYANSTPADVLVRERLDEIAAKKPNVRVHYLVSRVPDEDAGKFDGTVARITLDTIRELCPPHADDSVIFVCGPPPFMQAISGDKLPDKSQGPVEGYLKELGYTSDSVFKF